MPRRALHIDRRRGFWFVLGIHIFCATRIAIPAGATPMNEMKDRQEGFERKFAHDEELRFKAAARRNKALLASIAPTA